MTATQARAGFHVFRIEARVVGVMFQDRFEEVVAADIPVKPLDQTSDLLIDHVFQGLEHLRCEHDHRLTQRPVKGLPEKLDRTCDQVRRHNVTTGHQQRASSSHQFFQLGGLDSLIRVSHVLHSLPIRG